MTLWANDCRKFDKNNAIKAKGSENTPTLITYYCVCVCTILFCFLCKGNDGKQQTPYMQYRLVDVCWHGSAVFKMHFCKFHLRKNQASLASNHCQQTKKKPQFT